MIIILEYWNVNNNKHIINTIKVIGNLTLYLKHWGTHTAYFKVYCVMWYNTLLVVIMFFVVSHTKSNPSRYIKY